ncbi:MAG: DNA topoisomerase IB [Actinobacteria bacterium]|nr:DNA topoisomerase IB [Actinomycetota bacterium]
MASAELAGLVHVCDDQPGITRRGRGRGFSYHDPDGGLIRDQSRRGRIEALAIPPAWTDVWICPDPNGHIQATGRDDRGRKQYRYHDRWREVRDAVKFHRLGAFGGALGDVRRRVDRDLSLRSMSREKVLAITVALLDESLVRVGNEEYVEENGSYGLTTLRPEHVDVNTRRVRIAFVGKGGKQQEVEVSDRRLARAVRRCEEIPGQCLFTYADDGGDYRAVESGDVNQWLRETTGANFTAKDFRTWGGTVVATTALHACGPCDDQRERDRNWLSSIDAAAEQLGNSRAVARSGYVHPALEVAYAQGVVEEAFRNVRARRYHAREEVALMRILGWVAS